MLIHRHESAGERLDSPTLDRARTLDLKGRADASRLPELLARHEVSRILSSPYRRCVDSVRPLATACGLEIEQRDELSPEAPLTKTKALLDELPDSAFVCTHREVIDRLFGGKVAAEKGGTWVVERRRSRLVPVEYIPTPTRAEASPGSLVRSAF